MSKVLLVVDNHLVRTPDGRVWSKGIYDYSFFARYLTAFTEVFVVIRVSDIDDNHKGYSNLCSGDGVNFLPLQDFVGVKGYILNFFKVKRQIKMYSRMCDCAIIRLPSAIGYQFAKRINKKKPYALEVVVDPWDFAAPGMLKMRFRSLIRRVWTRNLKRYCLKANGVSYVTQHALQNRYPCRAQVEGESTKYFQSYYSSANIPISYFDSYKEYYNDHGEFKLIHVVNAINSYVKGHKEAIDVVKSLNSRGYNVSITFVGDGEYIDEFLDYAEKEGISNKVHFIGRISDKNLMRKELRNADLSLLPTHGEGLPRVLIESMAVGTPCVSTNVNGIPELLTAEQMADVGDINRFVVIIEDLIDNPEKLTNLSKAGIEKAKEYSEDNLQIRRTSFYKKLANLAVDGDK